MARGFAIGVLALLVLGGVAALAYQAGVSAAVPVPAPSGPPAAYPYYWHPFVGFGFPFFGFLFPLIFVFLVFGLVRAVAGGGWGHHGGHRRMLEEWHREMHERQGSGSGDR
ncbi:MAG: hypothetical protein KGJ98_06415 [Chloroflexota bacterium]|nr:hypothetical protein [Chloroflexota bacterium]MDE3101856.1 hypothetical protein [Chloroflexota bacterium]